MIMKKSFLAYLVMLASIAFTACQTEELKPTSKTQEAVDQSGDVTNAKVTPLIKISSATITDTGTGYYFFTFGVAGAGDYCAPSGNLTVTWFMRQHDASGKVISEVQVKKDTQAYSCIKKDVKYVIGAKTGMISGGQVIYVSFFARFYNAQGNPLATASTGVGVYNTPQAGL
jgi:hypothetical protein